MCDIITYHIYHYIHIIYTKYIVIVLVHGQMHAGAADCSCRIRAAAACKLLSLLYLLANIFWACRQRFTKCTAARAHISPQRRRTAIKCLYFSQTFVQKKIGKSSPKYKIACKGDTRTDCLKWVSLPRRIQYLSICKRMRIQIDIEIRFVCVCV